MTDVANANLMDLVHAFETTYGTAASGNYTRTRFTSESLKRNQGSTASAEVRSDRQVSDLIRTALSTAGDIAIELSYAAFDDFLIAGLLDDSASNAWNTGQSFNGSCTFAAGSITATSGLDVFSPGDVVRVEGGVSNTGKIVRILTVAANALTVDGDTLVAESSVTVDLNGGEYIANGTKLRSLSIEKAIEDISTPAYDLFLGQCVNGFSLSVSPEAILTGTFSFIGKLNTPSTSKSGGTYQDAPTNDVMNAIDNFRLIAAGATASVVTAVSVELNNNLRARTVVGLLGAHSIASGTVSVTGSFTALFEDLSASAYAAFTDYTDSDAMLIFSDNDASGSFPNEYAISLPRIKFGDGDLSNPGINTDIPLNLSFTAIRDADAGETIRIHRFAAA